MKYECLKIVFAIGILTRIFTSNSVQAQYQQIILETYVRKKLVDTITISPEWRGTVSVHNGVGFLLIPAISKQIRQAHLRPIVHQD